MYKYCYLIINHLPDKKISSHNYNAQKKPGDKPRLFDEEQIDFELIGFVVSNFVVLSNVKTCGLFFFRCTYSYSFLYNFEYNSR